MTELQLKVDGAMLSLKLGASLPTPLHLRREMEWDERWAKNNYMLFPIQTTGELNFFLNAKKSHHWMMIWKLTLSFLPAPHLFFAFNDLSPFFKSSYSQHFVFALIITSLFIYSFFPLFILFFPFFTVSSPISIPPLSATLSLKFLFFWKVPEHYVTDALIVRAET